MPRYGRFRLQPYTKVCTVAGVKRRDLESELAELGWEFVRHGGNHDIWGKGEDIIPVPRHNEINENLARKILKQARGDKR